MYERKYKDLHIVEIKDPARRGLHQGYRFIITDYGATAHSAYRTEGGLNRFLRDSGLILRWREENETVKIGELIGEYRDICLMKSRQYFEDMFSKGRFFKSFRLCNGDYTAHYCDGRGVMVHLNPNIRDRETVEHFQE